MQVEHDIFIDELQWVGMRIGRVGPLTACLLPTPYLAALLLLIGLLHLDGKFLGSAFLGYELSERVQQVHGSSHCRVLSIFFFT